MHSNRIECLAEEAWWRTPPLSSWTRCQWQWQRRWRKRIQCPREWKLPIMRLVLIKSMTLFCNASAIDMHASESSAVSFHAVGRLPVVLLPVRHTQHLFLPCYGAESVARPYQWSSETISSRAPVAVVAVKTGGMQNPLSTIAQRTSMQTPVYNLHQRLPIWSLDKQAVWAESMSKWCFVLSAVGCIWHWFVWH